MIHAIEILRLPILALYERIERELQDNPVLELGATSDEPPAAGEDQAARLPIMALPERIEQELQDNSVLELGAEKYGRYLPLNCEPVISANAAIGNMVSPPQPLENLPDIIVEKNREGEYEVRVVDDWPPNLCISYRYMDMLRDQNCDEKASEFLRRKIQAAKGLIEAIDQRRNILVRVTKAIMRHQRDFLDKGPEYLKQLHVQQIAEQAEVHGDTVTCAVENKWIDTPHGAFALQCFFGEGY